MKEITLGSWEDRFWAWLIDIILVNALTALVVDLVMFWNPEIIFIETFFESNGNFLINIEGIGVHGVIMFTYWTILEGYRGQSIGKIVLDLRVTDRVGEKIGFFEAAVESFGKAFLLPLDCLIGWIAMSGENLRLFNRLSNTIVIKSDYEEPEGVKYKKD